MTKGKMIFETVPGFVLQAEWLFAEPRPKKFGLLTALLDWRGKARNRAVRGGVLIMER